MKRVTDPLTAMGVSFTHAEVPDRLPLTIHGAHPLEPLDWDSRVASAQVKSAILFAGLTGGAFALVTEPRRSRDHTERMLTEMGAPVISHATERGWRVELRDPPRTLDPLDFAVPGDPSSAAFVLALGALGCAPGAVTVEGIGLNPTRTAFFDVLERMGVVIEVAPDASATFEPIGDVTVSPSALSGVSVGEAEVPSLIDEVPMIAVLGSRAEGVTRITGAAELRAKESDRISALVANLRSLGVEVEELPDGLVVVGSDQPRHGHLRAFADHRIVMAFSVLAAVPGNDIRIDAPKTADVSFPGFAELIHRVRVGRVR